MSVIRTEFCPWRFEEPRLFLHNVDVLLKNRSFLIWIVFLLSSFFNIRLDTMYNQGGISYNQAPATLDDIKALLNNAITCYYNVIKPFSKNSGNINAKFVSSWSIRLRARTFQSCRAKWSLCWSKERSRRQRSEYVMILFARGYWE